MCSKLERCSQPSDLCRSNDGAFVDLFAHRNRTELTALGFFPSVARSLHGITLMAPRDPRAVAVRTYGASILRFVSRNPWRPWLNYTDVRHSS